MTVVRFPQARPHLVPDIGFENWKRWARVPAHPRHAREQADERWLRRWRTVSPAVREAAARGELPVDPVWSHGVAARAISARVFGSSDAAEG